jgi:spermidine synthase
VVHARSRGKIGGAVGEVLAFNTVGAILGAAATGFVLIFLLGVERSLQVLIAINAGAGLVVLAAALAGAARRAAAGAAIAATVAVILALAILPHWGRMWDRKYFAIFRNNQRYAFETPAQIEDALRNTDVLYYHEGINETISVIQPKKAERAFIVNGRVEASTHIEDVQCQRTLGHLPMLAHPDPKRVFVLGTGTGMTLGAVALHPEVESITLAEIEPGVLGATRQFADYNGNALDAPQLRVVFNDGRNFLRTTREAFDVITADPIHPWSGGAAYLYTDEYWQVVASRLAPGGVVCQWLPIYELSVDDLKSVVATFAGRFRYVALWLTHYDAELLASQEPIVFDETRMDARIAASPGIASDLAFVDMGTARDFLAYMIAGDRGVRAFAEGGTINTDDNLWLEFSSPRSKGVVEHMGDNVTALGRHRESPLAYTVPLGDPAAEADRRAFWSRVDGLGTTYDEAHALGLWNRWNDAAFRDRLSALRSGFPEYAPARFLEREVRVFDRGTPVPVAAEIFPVTEADGSPSRIELTALTMLVGKGRGAVVVVDNARREVYAERYLDVPEPELQRELDAFARWMLAKLRAEYGAMTAHAGTPGRAAAAARLKAVARAEAATGGSRAGPSLPVPAPGSGSAAPR